MGSVSPTEGALYHPKCGTRFPEGDRTGHCAGCCETFYGLEAFDKHQVRTGGRPLCVDPANDPNPKRRWRRDGSGRWREGKRMSDEALDRLKHVGEAA